MPKIKIVNKKKFLSRVSILVVILIMLIILINMPSKNTVVEDDKISLIVDFQKITDSLKNEIYLNDEKKLYISTEDIKNIFDKNLYYEEETGKVITTSNTKTAAIDVNSNTMEVNSASLVLSSGVIKKDDLIYIPMSEVKGIYNIDINVKNNSIIILSLYKELTTVSSSKKISLKEDTSFFAKEIQKIEKGQELLFVQDAEKSGWLKVLTYEGNFGYVKENEVSKKKQVRVNMDESDFSSKEPDMNNAIELGSKTLTSKSLKDFTARKKVIEDTISKVVSNEKYTVNINLNKVELDEFLIERFIVELIPRLKEVGARVIVTNNNNKLSDTFINENNLK